MTNILLAANHYAVASGRYMANAFRRAGHDVKTFGPAMGNRIWGIEIPEKYVWKPDGEPGIASRFDHNVKDALAAFPGWKPDLILVMDSALDVIGRKEDFPCPKVLFGVDNHVRNYWRHGDNWFTHKFLAHHDGPALPVCDCSDMTWLPCGYDPIAFRPSPIPMAERKYDIALVGYPYPQRQALVEAMRNAGLAVFATLGALYDDYEAIYHDTRISLCSSAAGDLAQRVFETAAMGCAILTDRLADLPRLDAREYEHYAPYSSVLDAVSAASLLLGSPHELERMAAAGQEWARPHSWDARAKTILETMKL